LGRSPETGDEPFALAQDLFAAAPLPVASLDDAQRLACLRLIRSENVGPATFRALINHYGGAQAALEALPEIARASGRKRPIKICPRDLAEAELEAAAAVGARPLFTIEPGYPALLAHVELPPPMLYVKGRIALLNQQTIAIVGSRDASAGGLKIARDLAHGLGAAGWVVASGLARGIDAAAHVAARPTGTVAVLGGGIDIIYPPEHADLQAALGTDGCLVSEMPPGFQPRGQDFPRRNRIISGISRGTVVVEAARRSGTLITARFAGEQGRDVFAVPGHPLDPRAEGTNQLLKDGAILVTDVEDILRALQPIIDGFQDRTSAAPSYPQATIRPVTVPPRPDQSDHDRILEALGVAPIAIDEVARATNLPVRTVQIVLTDLALAERITLHGGQLVSLRIRSGSP
jgi:DNA processing protein